MADQQKAAYSYMDIAGVPHIVKTVVGEPTITMNVTAAIYSLNWQASRIAELEADIQFNKELVQKTINAGEKSVRELRVSNRRLAKFFPMDYCHPEGCTPLECKCEYSEALAEAERILKEGK